MVAALRQPRFTATEYLAWENLQLTRHEYIDGEIYAMSGGTLTHSELAANLVALCKNHLRGKGCRVLNSDAKVSIHEEEGPYFYPDMSVTCDDRDRTAQTSARYPKLIVEVLSPSTEAYDRGLKFGYYRQLESLQDYVLISTDRINVEVFTRNTNNKWELATYGSGEDLELISLNLMISIDRLYEDIVLTVVSNPFEKEDLPDRTSP